MANRLKIYLGLRKPVREQVTMGWVGGGGRNSIRKGGGGSGLRGTTIRKSGRRFTRRGLSDAKSSAYCKEGRYILGKERIIVIG